MRTLVLLVASVALTACQPLPRPVYPTQVATTRCAAPGTCVVHVFGQVDRPGSVGYRPAMTLTQAIAASGGFTPLAYKRVIVTRGNVRYRVSIEPILEGRAPDMGLAPGDVVFVTERWI